VEGLVKSSEEGRVRCPGGRGIADARKGGRDEREGEEWEQREKEREVGERAGVDAREVSFMSEQSPGLSLGCE
jgi:hypothetical protein